MSYPSKDYGYKLDNLSIKFGKGKNLLDRMTWSTPIYVLFYPVKVLDLNSD